MTLIPEAPSKVLMRAAWYLLIIPTLVRQFLAI
jgi:hypothetical protein